MGLASIAEDPGIRQTRPGDEWRLIRNLIPAFAPEIVNTANGPAVVHSSDFTPVSSSRPARRGEMLSLFARHLGPTRPGIEPAQSFAASPLQTVNSPIEILVNESPAEVLAATGYPNSADGYQVNFRVPDDAVSGRARLLLSAAWIAAPEIAIEQADKRSRFGRIQAASGRMLSLALKFGSPQSPLPAISRLAFRNDSSRRLFTWTVNALW